MSNKYRDRISRFMEGSRALFWNNKLYDMAPGASRKLCWKNMYIRYLALNNW